MGVYFRKRIKVFPGVHVNLSKSGKGGIEVISGGIESTANTASRVKFSVAVSLPRMKPNFSTQNPDYGVSDCNETD